MSPVHSPYTAEGSVEGMRRFATAADHAVGWRRRVAVGLAWILPAGMIATIVLALVVAFVSHLR